MKEYLGGGVYAEYDTNTERIILTEKDGMRATNVIYMDWRVEDNLMNFINKINADERAVIVTSQGEVDTMEMGLDDNRGEK